MTEIPMGTVLKDGTVYVCKRNYAEGERHIVLLPPKTNEPMLYGQWGALLNEANDAEIRKQGFFRFLFLFYKKWDFPDAEELEIILKNKQKFPMIKIEKWYFEKYIIGKYTRCSINYNGSTDRDMAEIYNSKCLAVFVSKITDKELNKILHTTDQTPDTNKRKMILELSYTNKILCFLQNGINHQNNDFVAITDLDYDILGEKILWHGWVYPALWEFDEQKNRWVAQYDPFWHHDRVLLNIQNIEDLETYDNRIEFTQRIIDQIKERRGEALVLDKQTIKNRFENNKYLKSFVL